MKFCSIQLELSSLTGKNETLLQIDPLVKESLSCDPVQKNESLVNTTPITDKESLELIEPPLQTNETLASMEKNLWSSVNEQPVNRETLEPSVTAKRVVNEIVKQHDKEG